MAWTQWRTTKRLGRRAYTQWRDPRGRQCSEPANTSDPRRAELHRLAIEQREEARTGRHGPTDQISLGEEISAEAAVLRFEAHLLAARRSEATLRYYGEKLGALVAAWAEVPMSRWTRPMFEGYIASRPAWSPRTVQMVINAARRFVAWAGDAGVVCPDFVGRLQAPRQRPPKSSALPPNQVRALLEEARGHPLELPIALAVYTGLSVGDIRALTWAEIEDGWIVRRRQKTGVQLRIPIVGDLAEILARYPAGDGAVCRGLPRDNSSLTRGLRRLQVRAGIPEAPRGQNGWHRLRHTAGTILGQLGVDVATIGRILGHRPGSPVTLRYLHTDDERVREALEGAAARIRGGG